MAVICSRPANRFGRTVRIAVSAIGTVMIISLYEWNVVHRLQSATQINVESFHLSPSQERLTTEETSPALRTSAAKPTRKEEITLSLPSLHNSISQDDNRRLSEKEFKQIQDLSTWDYPQVDVVYTWVNGSDTSWLQEKSKLHQEFLEDLLGHAPAEKDAQGDKKLSNGDNRFQDHEELKYSLRSISRFAPRVNKIFVVVADGQVPYWLNTSHPKLHVIPHSQIFRDSSHLPTFNSCSIEANLINIPGLSEYFLYFNDDVFLGKPVQISDFFWSATRGTHRVFVETFDFLRIGCTPQCPKSRLGNKICDAGCNVPACGWDMGDCGQDVIDAGMKQIELERKTKQHFTSANGDFLTTLKYVDGLYNRVFGKSEGKVERRQQQHLPLLFSKRMLADLLARFPYEFNQTSSHRFRHPQDMVFAFSYFYYLEAVRVYAPSRRQIWFAAVDTLRAQEPFLYGNPRLPLEKVEAQRRKRIEALDSFSILQKCAEQFLSGDFQESKISVCVDAVEKLYQEELRLPANDFVIEHQNDHRFVMVNDDMEKNKEKLNEVIRSYRKFNNINDDSTSPSEELSKWFATMYATLFPHPCPYEKNS